MSAKPILGGTFGGVSAFGIIAHIIGAQYDGYAQFIAAVAGGLFAAWVLKPAPSPTPSAREQR